MRTRRRIAQPRAHQGRTARRAAGTADTDFGPQLRDLADTCQVVSFDPRGYGQSRPPERDFPLDFYQRDAADAAALMAALGHSKYAVMGWSDGAISAVMLAAAYAPHVDRLVIFGGSSYFTQDDIDAFEATRDVEGTWSKRMKETHCARVCTARGSDGPTSRVTPCAAARARADPTYGAEGLQRLWSGAIDAWAGLYKAKDGDLCRDEAKSARAVGMARRSCALASF